MWQRVSELESRTALCGWVGCLIFREMYTGQAFLALLLQKLLIMQTHLECSLCVYVCVHARTLYFHTVCTYFSSVVLFLAKNIKLILQLSFLFDLLISFLQGL